MATLSTDAARALAALRKTKGQRNPRRMIIEVQQLLLKDIRKPNLSAATRAKCAVALERLEERLRILNGTPLPGMLRPDGDWRTPKKRKPTPVVALPDVAPKPSKESLSPPEGGGGVPPVGGPGFGVA